MDARRVDSSGPRRGLIQLELRDLAQLFNSMDPSPFHERDLDPKAEEFIVGWANDFPRGTRLELRVHLTQPPRDPALVAKVEPAIQSYFAELVQVTRRDLRTLFAIGRTSLLIGLAFLAGCMLASRLIGNLGDQPFYRIVAFGLEIAGWVAMWRPFEIFLYDWWPILRRRRQYQRLSHMPVSVLTPESDAPRGISVGSSGGSR
jgi:hypothetical protein